MSAPKESASPSAPASPTTRRAALAAALAMPLAAEPAAGSDAIAALIARAAERNAAFMRGDMQRWAELVYDGLWYSPLKRALDTFIDEAQAHVSGDIRLTLHGGRAVVTGRRSEASLYDFSLATYDEGDMFDQSLARGFVELWGLPSRLAAARDARLS